MGRLGAKRPDPDEEHHYSLDLSPAERDTLLAWLRTGKMPAGSHGRRAEIARRLSGAKRHPGQAPPDAALDWEEIEAEARRQGCDVVDVIFDRAHGREPA